MSNRHLQEVMMDRMINAPRSRSVCAALANPAEIVEEEPLPGEDVTEKIQTSLSWMAADMDFRRKETGLEAEPQSPEMNLVHELLADFEAGRIVCLKQ